MGVNMGGRVNKAGPRCNSIIEKHVNNFIIYFLDFFVKICVFAILYLNSYIDEQSSNVFIIAYAHRRYHN